MKFEELISKTGELPCFTTGFLAAGQRLAQLRLQLDRWCKAGRVIRLTRGVYSLAEAYRKNRPEPFYIGNVLKSPSSYVSLQSALAWYGLIPEHVVETTSVTVGRPGMYQTPLGRFSYRHVSAKRYWGYQRLTSTGGLPLVVARAEKALLDLVYLTPGGDAADFLTELRLQNTEQIDTDTLGGFAERFATPKMMKACRNITRIIRQDQGVSP